MPGRQFLVSQSHASILSNLVAVALTLAGPRLWILIKAFLLSTVDIFTRYRRSRERHPPPFDLPLPLRSPTAPCCGMGISTQPQRSQHTPSHPGRQSHLEHDTLEATQTSHSELGAALKIIRSLWHCLRSGSIKLSTGTHPTYRWPKNLRIMKSFTITWKNLLRRPIDVLASLLLSSLFVGIFVAESTFSVLSAKIVGDTTALGSSPNCSISPRWNFSHFQPNAFDYSQRCYRTRNGIGDCNSFYNQTIGYTETTTKSPFAKEIRLEAEDSALTFDTGVVDAKVIGINSAHKYQFRRTAICIPLKAKNRLQELKVEDDKWTFGHGWPGTYNIRPNQERGFFVDQERGRIVSASVLARDISPNTRVSEVLC